MIYEITVSEDENTILEAVAQEKGIKAQEIIDNLFQRALLRFMRNFIEDVASLNTEDQSKLFAKMAAEKKIFTDKR